MIFVKLLFLIMKRIVITVLEIVIIIKLISLYYVRY
jgi:hypothetical protein